MTLKCTECGASIDQITIDAQIIVTFRLNEKGEIDRLKHGPDEKDLVLQAQEAGHDYLNAFCDKCGTYMGLNFDATGQVIGFNNNPPKWK